MPTTQFDRRAEVEVVLPEPGYEPEAWFAPLDLLFAGAIPFDEYLEMTNG